MEEKVNNVICGAKHVICKTANGNLYTWGWGGRGQLGHGNLNSLCYPKRLVFEETVQRVKPIQIMAGYRHTMVMFDDRKIFWWGTNGDLRNQDVPIRLDIPRKVTLIIFCCNLIES